MAFGSFYTDGSSACYRPAVPVMPPLEDMIEGLQKTNAVLVEFDRRVSQLGVSGSVGRLFARLDAVHSSGAEGSTTTFTDLMEYESLPEAAPDPADARIVAACADAFEASIDTPNPLDAVLAIHRRLFENDANPFKVRSAGSFKTLPNSTYDGDFHGGQFYYTHPSQLPEALEDWLGFTMQVDPRTPELIRQLCSHWMFESVHPVMDGNGRIGRLLLPLVMKWKGATTTGCTFIGEAVHSDKEIYIDALKDVRRTGDFTHWCNIGMSFVRQTAESNIERLDMLDAIAREWNGLLEGTRKHSVLHRLLPWMLTKPAFTVKDASIEMGVSFTVANSAIETLLDKRIVSLAGQGRRNRLFLATSVLDAFDRFRAIEPTPVPPVPLDTGAGH